MGRIFGVALLATALACAMPAQADPQRQQVRDLQVHAMAAYKAGDFAQAAKDFAAVLVLRPHHPAILYNFAAVSAKAGHASDAINSINEYATMGLVADFAHDADFDAIKDRPAFKAALAKIDANRAPIGTSSIIATLTGAPFLAEGIAFDPATKRFFVSSVDQRKIVQISPNGQTAELVPSARDGLLGAFGIALDAKQQLLWVSSSGVAHARGLQPAQRDSAGVFAFSLADGHLARRVIATTPKLVIADLMLTSDDTVYATDSLAPQIYAVTAAGDSKEPAVWLRSDDFVSLQGMTTTPDGKSFIVADYAMGLHFVDRATKAIHTISYAGGTTLLGIDGLYRTGNTLLAVQNGIAPQRIVALTLAADGQSITQAKVLSANDPQIPEPSLGTLAGDKFCVVANAQWDKFKDDGSLKNAAALDPVHIACVTLVGAH